MAILIYEYAFEMLDDENTLIPGAESHNRPAGTLAPAQEGIEAANGQPNYLVSPLMRMGEQTIDH